VDIHACQRRSFLASFAAICAAAVLPKRVGAGVTRDRREHLRAHIEFLLDAFDWTGAHIEEELVDGPPEIDRNGRGWRTVKGTGRCTLTLTGTKKR
jgi:hypothetical protein